MTLGHPEARWTTTESTGALAPDVLLVADGDATGARDEADSTDQPANAAANCALYSRA